MRRRRITICTIGLAIAVAQAGSARADERYVDDDAGAGHNGHSWLTPYHDLEDALAEAHSNPSITEIRVAGGRYVPSTRSDPGIARTETFQLVVGLALYGGYAGLADPGAPDVRDPAQYESILSGDLDGDDGPDFAKWGSGLAPPLPYFLTWHQS